MVRGYREGQDASGAIEGLPLYEWRCKFKKQYAEAKKDFNGGALEFELLDQVYEMIDWDVMNM